MKRPTRVPDSPFWVEPECVDLSAKLLALSGKESHHLLHVFRAAKGSPFEAIDGAGSLYRCVLEGTDGGAAIGRIESRVENSGELPWTFALLVGLPDLSQAESLVAHAVPLNVTSIDFAVASRSGREELTPARLERLVRIARSALKQSRRTRLPVLRSSETLELAVADLSAADFRWVADSEGAAALNLPERPNSSSQIAVSMAVGPPGGFIEWERGVLRGAAFAPISLGPSRLSTSTAALSLLACARNLLLASGLPRVDKTGVPGYLQ
jgi:16S rRNA (uracil1498-N3)-methyltransferase